MSYRDCQECGSQCCRFFGVPADQRDNIRTEGVPLDLYRSELEGQPERYFELREGVTVRDGVFVVDEDVRIEEGEFRLGRYLMVHSRCKELGEDGGCRVYANRPDMCRNFVAQTAEKYMVPAGCIFDHNGLGEDFGV